MSIDNATDDIKIAHMAISSDCFGIQFSPRGPLVDEVLDTTQLVLLHGSISVQVRPSYPPSNALTLSHELHFVKVNLWQ